MNELLSNGMILMLLIPILIIELGLMVFCLVKAVKEDVQYLPKWAWILIVLCGGLLGSIAFLIFGRVKD